MRPINRDRHRDRQFQIDYHLGRNDAPEFDAGQPERVGLARYLLGTTLRGRLTAGTRKIVELGCGAGDISGLYSRGADIVYGYDVVPVAKEICARRWPNMNFTLGPVEEQEPIDCDVLVMCEFLEHVDDPISIVKNWLPHAKFAIIGHPLDDKDGMEYGHCWSYEESDWHKWYEDNGFSVVEKHVFPMGSWDRMILGVGGRDE